LINIQVPDAYVKDMQDRANDMIRLLRETCLNEAEVMAILNAAWTWAFAENYHNDPTAEPHLLLTLDSMRDATLQMMAMRRGEAR
jgi:hypothetical protein